MAFKEIPIAETISSSLTDFPIYVKPSVMTGWESLTTAEAESIRFYADEAKTTELPREVVSADEIHVKRGTLDTGDSVFADYDGVRSDYATDATFGAENVWNANYDLASHDGGGTDSTSNANDGTGNGGVTIGGVSGQIGQATSYDGVNDYVQVTGYKGILGTNPLSFSTIFNTTKTVDELSCLVMYGDAGGVAGEAMFISVENGVIWIRTLDGRVASFGSGFNDGNFHNLVVTYPSSPDLSDVKVYIDGSEVTRASISNDGAINIQSGNDVVFAVRYTDVGSVQDFFDVTEDENRFYQGELSADWITTEYNNQNDPANFFGTVTDVGNRRRAGFNVFF